MRAMFGILAVSLTACTFGANGKGSTSSSVADTGSSESTAADDGGDGPGMTSAADGQDDGNGSGSGTTMPASDEGPMTDSGPASTTDGGSQTDSGSMTDGGGSTEETGDSTTGGVTDPYRQCVDFSDCPAGYTCSQDSTCAAPCTSDDDCADPISGTAVGKCASPMYYPWCILNCDADMNGCPAGMACVYNGHENQCVW